MKKDMKRLAISALIAILAAAGIMKFAIADDKPQDMLSGRTNPTEESASHFNSLAPFTAHVAATVTEISPTRETRTEVAEGETLYYLTLEMQVERTELLGAPQHRGAAVPLPPSGRLLVYEPLGFERLASAFSEQRPTRQAPVTVMLTYKGGTPLAQLADWAVESAYVTSDGSAHFLGPWSEAADQALRNYRAAARAGAVDAQNDDAFIRAIAAEISSGEDGPILRAIKKANEPDLERDWAAKPVLTRFLDPSEAPPSVLGRLVRTPIQIKTAGDSTASGEEAVRVRTADGVSVAVPASPGRSAVIVAFLPPGGQVIVEVIHSSGANDDRGRPIGIRTLGTFNSAKFRVDDSKGERLSLTVSDRLLASVDLAERDLIEVADLHIEPAGQQVGS